MNITKLKLVDGKVHIEYERITKDGKTDEFIMIANDEPHPDLKNALQALAQDVVDICELPSDYATGLKVKGVSISYTTVDKVGTVMGAVITAAKTLKTANSPLNLNTPHLPERDYSPTETGNPLLPEETVDRIKKLQKEAVAYVDGTKRAQGSLEFAPAGESGK